MINQQEISSDWLDTVSKQHRNADKILTEKVIRALLLLEGLVKQNLPFVFKGGTALMLHFNSTKRLSIDIDIILYQDVPKLEELLNSITQEQGFVRYELQYRSTDSKIQKEHYKFFYNPLYNTRQTEEYVLLDILFEQVNYSKLVPLAIQSSLVPNDGEPLTVNVPSLEDILGDKLTAFAPNTTGIPYIKRKAGMGMEIIKQLYDIGNLIDVANDMEIIRATFNSFAATEIEYRNVDGVDRNDVLEDIYQTSLCIATRGNSGKGNFEELQSGIKRIGSFIFSESYQIEKAITHASKAAYLSVLIKQESEEIEKYKNPSQLTHWQIKAPMNTKLNKLKISNPEAFFYWYKIYEREHL